MKALAASLFHTTVLISLLAPTLATAMEPVSFRNDIVPLFARECAVCHLKEGPSAGLNLEPRFAYGMIVGVASLGSPLTRVKPGDPEHSYLLLKMQDRQLENGGSGDRMPPGWLFMTPEDIDLVRRWILQGALEN